MTKSERIIPPNSDPTAIDPPSRLTVSPYGSWVSSIPLAPDPGDELMLLELRVDGEDLYWLEGRPDQNGHQILVQQHGRAIADMTAADTNVRSRVHEYGGASYTVNDGCVYFTRFDDGRLYRQTPGEAPVALTPARALRFADLVVDERRSRLICVQEDHTESTRLPESQAVNSLVEVRWGDSDARPPRTLVTGNDFYSSPRLNPDRSRLAWITWNHPNMPWDGTELWVADFARDGSLGPSTLVAGGPSESVAQPEWSPGGVLHFVSDRSGWWNLYRWVEEPSGAGAGQLRPGDGGAIEAIAPTEAEFCHYQWRFGRPTYVFADGGEIIAIARRGGQDELLRIDPKRHLASKVDVPYSELEFICGRGGKVAFVAGRPVESTAVVEFDLASGRLEVVRRASSMLLDARYLSVPEKIEFPTERGLTAFGFYYPPTNPDFTGVPEERPPLVVRCHGGPTANASTSLDLDVQRLTSRGIGVLDVDHGGSTGYGRAYRERLCGEWGVVDVQDCVSGARYLAMQGLVDRDRLAITGKSAGGWTTLCAAAFTDVFRGGVAYFAITDLELWARGTHKFESRYLDGLIGPYPERRDLYLERSPTNAGASFNCPVVIIQGLDDRVVPRDQAEKMVGAVRTAGKPFAYVEFPDEGHGLRKAANIEHALRAELGLYAAVFEIRFADAIEPLTFERAGADEVRVGRG